MNGHQFGNAALIGLALSVVTCLWVRLSKSRSAEDRAALWAIGLSAVLAGSFATLLVKPWHVAIELPRASVPAKPTRPSSLIAGAPRLSDILENVLRDASPAASRANPSRSFWATLPDLAIDLWAIVAALLVAGWAAGYLQAFRLRRRSTALAPDIRARIDRLIDAMVVWGERGSRPSVRLSSEVAVPLTVTLAYSTILLPADAPDWTDERLIAVMAHELAHVRRRDGLARSMARLCAALHWFNPLVWLGARRLEEAQEIAADDAILDAGLRPSACARELLSIAESLAPRRRDFCSAGLSMVEPGSLMARLCLVLGPARSHRLSRRLAVGTAVVFAALTAGMVSLRATVSFAATQVAPMPGPRSGALFARAADDGGLYETMSAGVDGGPLAAPGDGSIVIADGQSRPGGMATDETYVYWTNFEGGSLMKAPLGGGTPATLLAGQRGPMSLAVGAGRIYWTNFEDGTVKTMSLPASEPAVLASGQDHPSGIALGPADLYWVNSDGSVRSVVLSGGSPVTLASGSQVAPAASRSIAIDSRYVYWTEGGELSKSNGRILRVPLSGGPTLVLARDQDNPCRLAVDGESVYWTNLGTWANRLIDGTVMKVDREGGPPVILAAGQLQPLGIALDGGTLYWTRAPIEEISHGIVMKMALPAGKPTVAAWLQHRPANIIAGASGVYWTNGDDGSVRSLVASARLSFLNQ